MKKILIGFLFCLLSVSSFAEQPWMPKEYEYEGISYQRGGPAEGENATDVKEAPEIFVDLDGDGEDEAVLDFGFAYKDGQEPDGAWGAIVIYDKKDSEWQPVKTIVGGDLMFGHEFIDVDKDGVKDLVTTAFTGNHYKLIKIYSFKDGEYKTIFENGTACYLYEIDAGSDPTKIIVGREDWDNNDFDYASSAELSLKEVYVWDGKEFVYSQDLSTTPLIGEKQAIENAWQAMRKSMQEINPEGESADSLQMEYTAKRWTAGSRVMELFQEDLKQAVDQMMEARLTGFYEQAQKAIEDGDMAKADFWMVRYMGMTIFNENTEKSYSDLFPLYEKRADLKPTAILSRAYSKSFKEFFVFAPQELWGTGDDGIIPEDDLFLMRVSVAGKYFSHTAIFPQIEAWTLMGDENRTAFIPLVSDSVGPFLFVGILKDEEVEKVLERVKIDTQGCLVQYIWPTEYYDLDGDGVPEIWLRYNAAQATGFFQVLDIYKIENDEEVVLYKRFMGEAEGIARRLPDGRIEVGAGFSSEGAGHMAFDKHHIETFEFKDGAFVKVAERDVAHILLDDAWMEYYFGEE